MSIKTQDGIDLFVRDWPLPAGTPRRGAALLVHGIGEHCGRYAHVAAALNKVGVAVRGYDHRGHGQSGGPRGVLPSINALVDDARLVFDAYATEQRQAGDPAPPFLIGHSLGGLVAARAVSGGWLRPRGLVLSSPALKFRATLRQRLTAYALNALAPTLARPSVVEIAAVSHDPEVIEAARADPLCHQILSGRLAVFHLSGTKQVLRDAGRIDVPTLLLVAGDDRIVDARGARELAAAMPAHLVTLKWYDELYHEVFNEREPDRTQVLKDLTDWIAQQAGNGSN